MTIITFKYAAGDTHIIVQYPGLYPVIDVDDQTTSLCDGQGGIHHAFTFDQIVTLRFDP